MHIIGMAEFERSSQGDDSFCAVHTTRMVLRHFGHDSMGFFMLGIALRTDEIEGTLDKEVLRVFRGVGLTARWKTNLNLFDVGEVLDCEGLFVAATTNDTHCVVVHGLTPTHVLVADPGYIAGVKINHALPPKTPLKKFLKDWTAGGILVTKK